MILFCFAFCCFLKLFPCVYAVYVRARSFFAVNKGGELASLNRGHGIADMPFGLQLHAFDVSAFSETYSRSHLRFPIEPIS